MVTFRCKVGNGYVYVGQRLLSEEKHFGFIPSPVSYNCDGNVCGIVKYGINTLWI